MLISVVLPINVNVIVVSIVTSVVIATSTVFLVIIRALSKGHEVLRLLPLRQVFQPKMFDQLVVIIKLLGLVGVDAFRENDDLATGAAGVVSATRFQVTVVENPGGFGIVWAVHVSDDSVDT